MFLIAVMWVTQENIWRATRQQHIVSFILWLHFLPRCVTIVQEPQFNETHDENMNKFWLFSANVFSENKPTLRYIPK